MTRQQRAYLLYILHGTPIANRSGVLNSEIQNFGLPENEVHDESNRITNVFNFGIKNINTNQLSNILKLTHADKFSQDIIKKRLVFYEINQEYHNNILQFFEDYIDANAMIDVGNLDNKFKGVQVATRDNFNTVINQGWTGDWILTPDNIEPKRIQIASMNDSGNFPRGCYINADIKDIRPVVYGGQIRYRVFISNPIIINTGNRNVRFNLNPVKYIK
jgi:hypothetical protein